MSLVIQTPLLRSKSMHCSFACTEAVCLRNFRREVSRHWRTPQGANLKTHWPVSFSTEKTEVLCAAAASGYKMIQVSKTNTNDNPSNSWHLLVRLAVTWVFGYFQMSSSLQPTFICQVRFVPQSSRLMAALYWQASSAQKGSKNQKKLLNQSTPAKCYCFFDSEFNSNVMSEMLP